MRMYCSCHFPDGSTTEVSDTKLCVDNAPALPVSREFRGVKIAYTWDVGEWGSCNAICSSGIRRRIVVCRRSDLSVAYYRKCVSNRPATVSSCIQVCRWATGDWSDCSITFGCGQQTRTVTCVQILDGSDQLTVANSHCRNDILLRILGRPAETLECERSYYKWVVQPWMLCSSRCGPGVEERDVACIKTGCDGKIHVEDSECHAVTGFIQKPNTTRECHSSCEYDLGTWSRCSRTCGPGVRFRVVSCLKILQPGRKVPQPVSDCDADTTIPSPRPPPSNETCTRGSCRCNREVK
ncbi:ADAMTS-like protein 2 isoform X2 [Corticium candelabrum]|nr:ADAMTS-like protein 2 isoform X2 [Corticium candelabrum]